jgi:hypothetical protein
MAVATDQPETTSRCLLRARYRGNEGGFGPTSLFTFLMHVTLVIACRSRIVERPLLGALWSRSREVDEGRSGILRFVNGASRGPRST